MQNANGIIISKVNNGFKKKRIDFGESLSDNFSIYDATQIINIIGITVDVYVARVTGIPKNSYFLQVLPFPDILDESSLILVAFPS